MGSFFAPETDMIFGDGVGASLVRGPHCQLDVGLCDVDVFRHWNSAAEEGAWVGLKPDLQGGTRFNLLRVHFWTPVQRKRVSKRGQKVARLKSKVVPSGGSSFKEDEREKRDRERREDVKMRRCERRCEDEQM